MSRRGKASAEGPELFIEPSGQLRLLDKSAEQVAQEEKRVECLGMTFESDEERRAYFLEKLREKLKDPEFRKIEGFPLTYKIPLPHKSPLMYPSCRLTSHCSTENCQSGVFS
jgi:hypothetical protein